MTDKEWREASDMRPSATGLAWVLGVAALLRFWSLGFGIPFAIGVDEPEIMVRVVTMLKTGGADDHLGADFAPGGLRTAGPASRRRSAPWMEPTAPCARSRSLSPCGRAGCAR